MCTCKIHIHNGTRHLHTTHYQQQITNTLYKSITTQPIEPSKLILSSDLPIPTTSINAISSDQFADCMKQLNVSPQHSIAVALSGGSDSTALTLLLHEWYRLHDHTYNNDKLLAICIDHGLRNEATHEIQHTNAWLKQHSIKFINHNIDNLQLNSKLQSTARDARYRILFDMCMQHGMQYVATGHQLDDQVETVLSRLYRATGLIGLQGIPSTRQLSHTSDNTTDSILCIRPLLSFNKQQCEATCRRFNQIWCIDATNYTDKYDRNRARNGINSFTNISSEQLIQLCDTMTQISTYAKTMIESLCNQYATTKTQNRKTYISLNVNACQLLHPSIIDSIIRQIVLSISPTNKFSSVGIGKFAQLLHNNQLDESRNYALGNCEITPVRRGNKLTLQFHARPSYDYTIDYNHGKQPLNTQQIAQYITQNTRVYPSTQFHSGYITLLIRRLLACHTDSIAVVMAQLIQRCAPSNITNVNAINKYVDALLRKSIVPQRRTLLGNCVVRVVRNEDTGQYTLMYIQPRPELVKTL